MRAAITAGPNAATTHTRIMRAGTVITGAANLHEQFQALARRQVISVTEFGDRHAVH